MGAGVRRTSRQRHKELTGEIAATVTAVSQLMREAIQRRVIPRFLSFGYLMRQYTSREHLGTMVAEARKGFEQAAQSIPPTQKADFLGAVEKAATMRRVDALIYLHRSLKMWLAHVLTTSLMLALMIVHIIQVVYFAVK